MLMMMNMTSIVLVTISQSSDWNLMFSIFDFLLYICLGGNQRDLARAKNQKKLADAKKGNRTDGLTVEQRKQRLVVLSSIRRCVANHD